VRGTLRERAESALALFPQWLARLGVVDREMGEEIFDLAVPVIVTGGLRTLLRTVDFFMVSLALGSAAVAVLLPVVVGLARRAGVAPSRLLMPLAFGSLLGGMLTLIGTPPNLVVSDQLRAMGREPFGFFAFTPVGATMLALGVAYMVVIGRHLLPSHDESDLQAAPSLTELAAGYGIQERLHAIEVPFGSSLAGRTLAEAQLRRRFGATVLAVETETQDGGSTGGGSMETVTLAYVPSAATAPIWVAEDAGYFEERGIELNETTQVSGSKATAQLGTGQLDIAVGAVGASTFNAIYNDVAISFSADEASSTPGLPLGNRYWIRDGLWEEGLTMDDLEGDITIALNASASVGEYMLARTLSIHDNLSWDNVEVVTMPFPQMISAMGSEAIDIAQQIDPLGPIMAQNVDAHFIEYSHRPSPELQIGGIIVGGPFENQRRDVAVDWHQAYILGIREMYDLGGTTSDAVANILSNQLENPVESIKSSVPYFHNKNGRLYTESVVDQQDYLACQGYVQNKVSPEDMFSTDLVVDALEGIETLPEAEERVGMDVMEDWQSRSPLDWPLLDEHTVPEEFPNDEVCGNPLTTN
jgi:ABC-type nitrate/sulfonate/bicarbonate transport system substrate-binding protein